MVGGHMAVVSVPSVRVVVERAYVREREQVARVVVKVGGQRWSRINHHLAWVNDGEQGFDESEMLVGLLWLRLLV